MEIKNNKMDKNQEHLDNLNEIRSIMEKSSSFISLSGLSGISAGIIGLAASYVFYSIIYSGRTFNPNLLPEYITIRLLLTGIVTLVITFTSAIYFTARKAKKKNLPVWSSSSKRLVVNLFIPLTAGGLFCLYLLYYNYLPLLVPAMIVFYGLALINASKYTLSDIKLLGITETALGLISLFFFEYAVLFWAIGFGVLNIIHGIVMYVKYER
jgi:hypothetical protein